MTKTTTRHDDRSDDFMTSLYRRAMESKARSELAMTRYETRIMNRHESLIHRIYRELN